MKKTLVLILSLFVLMGCTSNTQPTDKVKVVTSFYPLYDFATKIGGDKAEVTNIIPVGVEAHGFEPTPSDITNLENADMFIYHGAGFESWTDQVISSLRNDILLVEVSDGIDLILREEDNHDHEDEHEEEHETEHEEGEEHEEEHDHGIYDPHTWLDPRVALQEFTTIYEAFVLQDPSNEVYYTENYNTYKQQFDSLILDYDNVLNETTSDHIIVDHLAYSYLAHRYDLHQMSISGGIVNEEPTAKEIESTIAFIKENNVKVIYMETFSNQNVMDIISKETGAKILTLQTVETLNQKDLDEGKDYFSVMKENLNNLQQGLN